MQKKFVLAAVLAAAALAACGGGGSGSSADTQEPADTSVAGLNAAYTSMVSSGQYPTLDRTTSLIGMDANTNGVRDDIDAWLSKQDVAAAAVNPLLASAQAYQAALTVDVTDQVKTREIATRTTNAMLCLRLKLGTKAADALLATVKAYTFNTSERTTAYLLFDESLSGKSFHLPTRQEACNAL